MPGTTVAMTESLTMATKAPSMKTSGMAQGRRPREGAEQLIPAGNRAGRP
jgi:hypothetical protein